MGGGGTERDSRWDRRAPDLTVSEMADDLGLASQPEIIGLCRLSARRMGWQQESQQRRVARRESRQPLI
jgi:hypothetical protein